MNVNNFPRDVTLTGKSGNHINHSIMMYPMTNQYTYYSTHRILLVQSSVKELFYVLLLVLLLVLQSTASSGLMLLTCTRHWWTALRLSVLTCVLQYMTLWCSTNTCCLHPVLPVRPTVPYSISLSITYIVVVTSWYAVLYVAVSGFFHGSCACPSSVVTKRVKFLKHTKLNLCGDANVKLSILYCARYLWMLISWALSGYPA